MSEKKIRDTIWKISGISIIIFSAVLALGLRLIPVFIGDVNDPLSMVGMDDPMYNLRQIEHMIHNYPGYSWFEAMSFYPQGAPIHWGPLFTFIAATWCMAFGAVTRPALISTALYVAPLMAVVMVPLMYILVHRIANRFTGVVAAFLIAIVPGQYFYRSYYGYLDHHIAEVLFSTIYCLCFIICLIYVRKNPVTIRSLESVKIPLLLGVVAGIAYTLGIAVMPTMILFAMITALFTFFWFIYDKIEKKNADAILVVICSTFITAIIGYLLIGVHQEGLLLNYYTISHLIAYSLIIITTILLYALSRYLKDKPLSWYLFSFISFICLALIALMIIAPEMYQLFTSSLGEFFGTNIYYSTIQEARPWSLTAAWSAFGWSLILMVGGLIVLAARIIKETRIEDFFIFIWSLIIIYAAFQHIRYEYYFAVPLVILISLLIGTLVTATQREESSQNKKSGESKGHIEQKKKKISIRKNVKRNFPHIFLIIALVLTVLFVSDSLTNEINIGVLDLNSEWKESLLWMETNTPDPDVGYYTIYNANTWNPPQKSYGIMSWWDYGHMITFIAHRLPHANPFQQGVAGPDGAAAFFVASTEEEADRILDTTRTRYIMTDIEMDTGKFWAMATWDNSDTGVTPYMQEFLFPEPGEQNLAAVSLVYKNTYFQTLISRLHNFDGSFTVPENVTYIEYITPDVTGYPYPLVINMQSLPYITGTAYVELFNASAPPGYMATLISESFDMPVEPIPALKRYRLVHESPSRVTSLGHPDIRYVKIFEYVPGAIIKGDGIIEIPLVIDGKRAFFYRQQSEDGQFIVPYPTDSKAGDVQAAGPYHNLITGETYSVTEEQIQTNEIIS